MYTIWVRKAISVLFFMGIFFFIKKVNKATVTPQIHIQLKSEPIYRASSLKHYGANSKVGETRTDNTSKGIYSNFQSWTNFKESGSW